MMPSIGVSAADSTSQAAGGSPIFSTQRIFGRNNRQSASNTTSWSPTTTSEATAKTDMGGGMLGGLMGGGSEGGGFGLGGLVSGITGALGIGKKSGTVGADGGTWADTGGGGPNWGLILLLGGCALGVGFLIFGFLRKD